MVTLCHLRLLHKKSIKNINSSNKTLSNDHSRVSILTIAYRLAACTCLAYSSSCSYSWEHSDFPILCDSCLGENPYVRMTNMGVDKACKVCTRPFTVFRWSPGTNMRYRNTILCQTCSKIRSCCQSCALDLNLALPVGVRDSVLKPSHQVPTSDGNKQFYVAKIDKLLSKIAKK